MDTDSGARNSGAVGRGVRRETLLPRAADSRAQEKNVLAWDYLFGGQPVVVALVEHGVGADVRGGAGEQLLLAINQVAGVVGGQLEAVAVGDGVCRAGLDAIAAEDAAVVIDVVDLGVALGPADAMVSVFSAASM